ncbi:extensin-like [Hypomesus transpacificus]|uniref:extensin-like n=1 Tax=Hypomesus transpacificus TaxID=137520 RepID=UPI001F081C1C|nr:extensin-like [Hypomesus transpacificus]
MGGRPKHLALSHSFVTFPHNHHQHHYVPPALVSAPPPPSSQHPLQQATRAPGAGPSSWGRSGDPQKAQQFLALFDRGEALARENNYHSVALSYGTLPRAPRRAAPSGSSSSLPRPREGPAGPSGSLWSRPDPGYTTLAHPRRSASKPGTANGLYRQPGKPNGTMPPHYYQHQPPPSHHPRRLSGETLAQPLRLDVPPEGDWRTPTHRVAAPPSVREAHPFCQPAQRSECLPIRAGRAPYGSSAQLCSLCQQLPSEPSRHYCQACGAYMARFRPAC